jgi:hypothetical protein
VTFTFHAMWMLCALASAALASTTSGSRRTAVLSVAGGFVGGAWWFGPARLPDAVWVGTLAAVVGALTLVRSKGALIAGATAGALGGVWMSMLRVEGLPWPVAGALAVTPPVISAYLAATRPRFAPQIVRDEGLLMTVTLGLAVAVLPRILDGWRSAVVLNIQNKTGDGLTVPAWAIGLTAGAAALGGLSTVWRRG